MESIDPQRLDLVAAFHDSPFGPHSPALLEVLKILRWAPLDNRYVIVRPDPAGPYLVVKQSGRRGTPLFAVAGESYADLAAAQCGVFRRRWAVCTGLRLVCGADRTWSTGATVVDEPDQLSELPPIKKPLLGYADAFSVRPGETIAFKVSSTLADPYQASLVRIRCADGTPDGAGYKETTLAAAFDGRYEGRVQHITAGSFISFADAPAWQASSFTLVAWAWPTRPGHAIQHIAGTWDEARESGYALVLDTNGAAALLLGDGTKHELLTTGVALRERSWNLLVASFDAERGQMTVLQIPQVAEPHHAVAARADASTTLRPDAGSAFRIAACHDSAGPARRAAGFYNGKLEAPRLAARALGEAAIQELLDHGVPPVFDADTIAHWDFSRRIASTTVEDISGHDRHGETINQPTRAMKGVAWDGSAYVFTQTPAHYGAIHFHDDDVHDCAWDTDFDFTVPETLASGIYAARVAGDDAEAYVPFVVSPPVGRATADVALILPTASYWAYANHLIYIEWPEIEHVLGLFTLVHDIDAYLFQNPVFGPSMYDHHTDGSGVCHSSRLRPILDIAPKQALWQFPADTHITDWLEARGITYDVLTEDDLDRHGVELLAPYRCVMTGTHPEYPSLAMMQAYDAYKAQGGRFMYLGGNGFYWRTHYHPERPGIVEMRRAEDGIRSWAAEGGEYYASFTGELGGMWRRMGRAPQTVAGTGMTAQGFDRSTFYRRTAHSHDPRARFIFEGVGEDEHIGDFGIIGGGAAGWEIDRADHALGTPPHALLVAQATDFSNSYHWMKEELSHTHAAIAGTNCPHVHADMLFYETPNGGAVFAASSIAWAGALAHNAYDNNVSRITENVLRRFVDPTPFD